MGTITLILLAAALVQLVTSMADGLSDMLAACMALDASWPMWRGSSLDGPSLLNAWTSGRPGTRVTTEHRVPR